MRKLFIFLLLCSSFAAAQCVGPALAAVQSAVNSASSGATVSVCAGSATWGSALAITNKNITLQGAGIGITLITVTGTNGAISINGASGTNLVRVTGMDLNYAGATTSNGMIEVDGTNFTVAFRLDHNHITIGNNGNTSRGIETNSVYGLIDHNTFDVTTTSSVQVISPSGTSITTDGGFTAWMQPLSLGTINAVYVEDNTFNYPLAGSAEDCIDAYSGARVVVRFNQFNNAHIGFHGTDSGGNRGPVSLEIYNNTFTNNTASGGGTTFRAATIRGGTGVMFNNTYGGTHGVWNGFTLQVFRACAAQVTSWGLADGTQYQLGDPNVPPFSSNASRTLITSGSGSHVCTTNRETFCHSDAACTGGGTCTKFFDGDGTLGYPVRDQPGIGPGQISGANPLYQWNNTGGVNFGTFDGGHTECDPAIANDIQANRDYFNNTVRPGYTSFTYPHPLQGGGGSPVIQVNPTSSTFSPVTVGQSSTPLVVTMTNVGTSSLTISSLGISGDYSIQSNTCGALPATIAAGNSCTANILFTPSQVGTRTGSFTITNNGPGPTNTVSLSGTGQAPTAAPKTLIAIVQ